MILDELSDIRLNSQQIAATEFKTACELVGWMGAMQAQDYPMVKWAIGLRLKNSSEDLIELAVSEGEILRTHLMRPTWHLVSAGDIYWMIELTSPQIKLVLKSRHNQLELSESVLKKTRATLEKILINGKNLTREEIATEFVNSGIKTDDSRLYHILVRSELDGLICSGPAKNNKHTYTLLQERVPDRKLLNRDESLAELAKRYFRSHGPATLQDFVWWSGLSVKEARQGMESVRTLFITETIGSDKYLLKNSFKKSETGIISVHLLPAFDEFLIGYKDRSPSLSLVDSLKTVSNNGIFHPVIVENGQVTGLWKRSVKKNKVTVELDFFHPKKKSEINMVVNKAIDYGQFLKKETEVSYTKELISKKYRNL